MLAGACSLVKRRATSRASKFGLPWRSGRGTVAIKTDAKGMLEPCRLHTQEVPASTARRFSEFYGLADLWLLATAREQDSPVVDEEIAITDARVARHRDRLLNALHFRALWELHIASDAAKCAPKESRRYEPARRSSLG